MGLTETSVNFFSENEVHLEADAEFFIFIWFGSEERDWDCLLADSDSPDTDILPDIKSFAVSLWQV